MGLRDFAKRFGSIVGIRQDLKSLYNVTLRPLLRGGAINRYMTQNPDVRKLQIGAGRSALKGWLCTDIGRETPDIVFMDACKPYPFDDNTFDYIYSEHMIEHITYPMGQMMLRECLRVLKPGGRIRTATPDMAALLGLHADPEATIHKRYIKWMTDTYLDGVEQYSPVFVLNNAFRAWGHQFLYDEPTLNSAKQAAGFTDCKRYKMSQSDDPTLHDIEMHGKHAGQPELVGFETLVIEAVKPG